METRKAYQDTHVTIDLDDAIFKDFLDSSARAILSIMENYHPSPEQLQDSEFMAKRKKAIADLKQKIAQTKGDQK